MSNSNQHSQSTGESSSSSSANNRPPTSAASNFSHQTSTVASRNAPIAAGASATLTVTEDPPQNNEEVLQLTLRPRPSVQWDEGVIDNEFLGRKSSKRCCIFHKQRPFGESSTDSSDDGNGSDGSSSSGGPVGNSKPIARKKGSISQKKVPDYQRFHA